MNVILKRIKSKIDKRGRISLYVPDLKAGDVEVILIQKEKQKKREDLLKMLPKHHLGKVDTSLRREDVYSDAR